MSVAGGTGSGVGAYLTRCIRNTFPNAFVLNQVVWPYCTGEVIVQNYNTLLTMSHLYQSSDALLVMNNDSLQEICSKRLHIKQVMFEDLNKVIANALACILQPAYKDSTTRNIRNCLSKSFSFLFLGTNYYTCIVCWNLECWEAA